MGVVNYDVVQANAFIGADFVTQGKTRFVRPRTGLGQGGQGYSPQSALKTLLRAQALATANQNDVIHLLAEGNSGGNTAGTYWTTDYQNATLDWAKDLVYLIGSPCGRFSPRSRIAFASDYATASNLFTVSANGCRFQNIHFFEGVASANPTGCLKVTGMRNQFINCCIQGIGHDNNDITDAYSLYVSGGENYFKHCVIGLDTISRGTADNAELVLAGGARNVFEECLFVTWAGANTHQFVKRAAATTDRSTIFERCRFINFDWTAGGGVTMLEVFDVTASGSPGGFIDLFGCSFAGAAAWEASSGASGIVRADNVAAAAASATHGGRALAVTGA